MDMPPPVDVSHSQSTGWPRPGPLPGPLPPPLGAQSENEGPNSSSACLIQPMPSDLPNDGFSYPPLGPQPCDWTPYPTHLTLSPPWSGRTSTLIAEPPTPRGRPAQVSALGRPISPWFTGADTDYPGEWGRFCESIDNGEKGRSMPKPHKKKRKKTWSSCAVRSETPRQAYSWSTSPFSPYGFDRSRSPSPIPAPLPAPLPYVDPPPVSAVPNRIGDPEKFSSFDDHRAYVANNPFVPSMAQSLINTTSPSEPMIMQAHANASIRPTRVHGAPHVPISRYILAFLFDTVPRQIYLYSLLSLPSLYFSRVASIFEDVGLTLPDILRISINAANESNFYPGYYLQPMDSPPVERLKVSWKRFTESLTYEWTVLSFVSVLMFPTISTTLQIDGALKDPYIRYSAFLALVCSLMSVSYGCLYIIGFNAISGVPNLVDWAEEAQKVKTRIWWNLWVLLAMPAIWFSWSIVFYIACVMILLWRTATANEAPAHIMSVGALYARIVITIVFMLGIVYLTLIIREFRRRADTTNKVRVRVFESADSIKDVYIWKNRE